VQLAKSSLAGLLLEDGDEDLAVLIVRSDLPENLDTEQHGERLRQLGLDEDELAALLPAIRSRADQSTLSDEKRADLRQAVSDRWADLVSRWSGR
jgi:hypothetical protein